MKYLIQFRPQWVKFTKFNKITIHSNNLHTYFSGFVDPPPAGAMPMPPEPEATPIVILDPPPPPYSECVLNVDCPTSEEEVKAAMLNFYKGDCCFDPKTVDGFFIHEITQMHAFRYVLDTFIETRTLEEMTEPYRNQQIDGPQNGPSPDKWAVFVNPPQEFVTKAKSVMDLPRSANVIPCNKCHSTGFTACNSCNGMGFSRLGDIFSSGNLLTNCPLNCADVLGAVGLVDETKLEHLASTKTVPAATEWDEITARGVNWVEFSAERVVVTDS